MVKRNTKKKPLSSNAVYYFALFLASEDISNSYLEKPWKIRWWKKYDDTCTARKWDKVPKKCAEDLVAYLSGDSEKGRQYLGNLVTQSDLGTHSRSSARAVAKATAIREKVRFFFAT